MQATFSSGMKNKNRRQFVCLQPGRCFCGGTAGSNLPSKDLPRPSYVAPFWVVYYNPLPQNHNKPKKELHWSPWVGSTA